MNRIARSAHHAIPPAAFIAGALLACLGCAGPGPTPFPTVTANSDHPPAATDYDTDNNGAADYRIGYNAAGRAESVTYLDESDGNAAQQPINLDAARATARRHLIIMLDSIPHNLIEQLYAHGSFRLFHPPSRVISPFPAMTDTSIADLFDYAPIPAVEAKHVADGKLRGGLREYVDDLNSPWVHEFDVRLASEKHGWSYLAPRDWVLHELGAIERALADAPPGELVTYVASTSGLGMRYARNGHVPALHLVDRMCHMLTHRYRGEINITLLSDHGHHYQTPHRRILLNDELRLAGYTANERLDTPASIVVPEFGLVSMACIYCNRPAQVARDTVAIEGVELTAVRDGDAVVVLSKNGRARIERVADRYRYTPEFGDPLQLRDVIATLQRRDRIDADGFAADRDWFAATANHVFPDPLRRLWRVWDGMLERPPQVVVSLEPGWVSGSGFLLKFIDVNATHGSLRDISSNGFVLTTLGELPQSLRMNELRAALHALQPINARAAADTEYNEVDAMTGATP